MTVYEANQSNSLNSFLYFQVVELIEGVVGQIIFGNKPVYQTEPIVIKSSEDYERLMTSLREHAVARLKVAFA